MPGALCDHVDEGVVVRPSVVGRPLGRTHGARRRAGARDGGPRQWQRQRGGVDGKGPPGRCGCMPRRRLLAPAHHSGRTARHPTGCGVYRQRGGAERRRPPDRRRPPSQRRAAPGRGCRRGAPPAPPPASRGRGPRRPARRRAMTAAAGVGHPRCGGTVATGHQSGAGGRQRAAAATHDRPVHPLGGAPWALRTREAGVGVARGSVHARPACGNRADRWSGRNAAHVGARPQNNAHTYCFSFEFTQTGSDERANICCISGETIQKSQ